MDGRASLYAVTFCSFCKGRLVPLVLNTCLKTSKEGETAVSCSLQWFVLKSILTACFTCLFVSNTAKLTELFRSVPIFWTECRDPVVYHSFLLGRSRF